MSQKEHSGLPPANAPDNESYACFVGRKEQIAAWLRSGYSVKGVWTACRRATLPIRGSYQTFWRYCRKHKLIVPRGETSSAARTLEKATTRPATSLAPTASPKVWPRLPGKPGEFIPKVEE